MTFTFRPAVRERMPLLIGLAGPSGSGKTYSALRIARGLANDQPFALIDTENGRALHYADDFEFEHGDLRAPFRPERYTEAIQAADQSGYGVIVVDSASHEHAGDGGLLDWHDDELERMGGGDANNMRAWITPKRAHKRFVSALLQTRAHLILCFRAEPKVEIVKNGSKWEIKPMASPVGQDGWIPIAEKMLPYELTLSLLLSASRPGLPLPIKLEAQHRPLVPLDQPLTEETGRRLGEWAKAGSTGSQEVVELRARLIELGDRIGKQDEIGKALAQPRDAAWLRRQIKSAEKSLAEGEGLHETAETAETAARPGAGDSSPSASDPEPAGQSQFADMVPASVRQEDRN